MEEALHDITHTLSILGQRWCEREANPRDVMTLHQQVDVPEIIARILAARGVHPQDAASFLNPTLRTHLPDPFHLKDMDKAAKRIASAIIAKETIGVFGDYDVDGATSSSLLMNYFRALGLEPLVHIPDRMKEGYGPNAPALLGLQARGAKLVITVDCGQMAFEPLKAAAEAGLDVIVADHHKGDVQMPEAYAIVNPNRFDEPSPHKQLAAVGVVFLLLVAVNKTLREMGAFTLSPSLHLKGEGKGGGLTEPELMQWLDIVALGTICDVVPLTGANRALVTQGLKVMRNRQNIGINAAMDVARLAEAPDTYHAGFVIGPRINAGGRVGKADLGVRLLTATDAIEARGIAEELNRFNDERKAIESLVLEEALQQAHALPAESPFILVAKEGWHPGVIGVVAGRLKEAFHKPTAVIALKDGLGKASARSVTGVDLGNAVVAAVHAGLLVGGGGHAMAAGFTVEEEKLIALQQFIAERITPEFSKLPRERVLWIDASIAQPGVTIELVKRIALLGPFGASHPQVRVKVDKVRPVNTSIVGDGHVRTILVDAALGSTSSGIKAMAFRSSETPLGQLLLHGRTRSMSVAGTMRINSWQGRESVDFFIDDILLDS